MEGAAKVASTLQYSGSLCKSGFGSKIYRSANNKNRCCCTTFSIFYKVTFRRDFYIVFYSKCCTYSLPSMHCVWLQRWVPQMSVLWWMGEGGRGDRDYYSSGLATTCLPAFCLSPPPPPHSTNIRTPVLDNAVDKDDPIIFPWTSTIHWSQRFICM